MAKKPELTLIDPRGDDLAEQLADFVERFTGKRPSPEEIEIDRKQLNEARVAALLKAKGE